MILLKTRRLPVKAASRAERSLFDTNLLLLRCTGFWRLPGRRGRGLALSLRAFFAANVACNVAFLASKLVQTALDTGSMRSLTENMSDVLCIAFSLLQLLVLLSVEGRLVCLLRRIDEQFGRVLRAVRPGPEMAAALSHQREAGRRLSLRIFMGFLGTGFNFAVIVMSSGKKKKTLPIPIWTPFPQDDPLTLAVLLLVEAVGVVLTVAGSGALSALLVNALLVVRAQFRELQRYFRAEAGRVPDAALGAAARADTLRRLVRGVKLHQAVYGVTDELCRMLAPFLTVQLGTIVFMICVALYQISMDPLDPANLRFIALVANVIVESFVVCWMGTQLSDEVAYAAVAWQSFADWLGDDGAMNVQLGLDDGNWHLQGKNIGYAIKFATMRSQKAPYIVVGNNVHVGLPVFLEMIRSSYSLLAFLQKRATRIEGGIAAE